VAPGFTLDLEGLRAAFDRVDDLGWNALGLHDADGPHVRVEGQYRSHEVWLRVLGNRSRVEGDTRTEAHGTAKILLGYFGRRHRRAQCRWLWHRRLRRIRVEKPSGAGLPLLPRAAILKALVGPADTIWWATL
jgi:hypothetical protein